MPFTGKLAITSHLPSQPSHKQAKHPTLVSHKRSHAIFFPSLHATAISFCRLTKSLRTQNQGNLILRKAFVCKKESVESVAQWGDKIDENIERTDLKQNSLQVM